MVNISIQRLLLQAKMSNLVSKYRAVQAREEILSNFVHHFSLYFCY